MTTCIGPQFEDGSNSVKVWEKGTDTMIQEMDASLLNNQSKRNSAYWGGNISGNCKDCEEEIPKERMTAVPGAIRCVVCQAIEENR